METNLFEDEPGLDLSVLCSCDHRYADPPTLDVSKKTLSTLPDEKRENVAANLRSSAIDWRRKDRICYPTLKPGMMYLVNMSRFTASVGMQSYVWMAP